MTADTRHSITVRDPRVNILLAIWIGLTLVIAVSAQRKQTTGINIGQAGDCEPVAVLRHLEKRRDRQPIADADEDWRSIFQSEGYIRLKRRERA